MQGNGVKGKTLKINLLSINADGFVKQQQRMLVGLPRYLGTHSTIQYLTGSRAGFQITSGAASIALKMSSRRPKKHVSPSDTAKTMAAGGIAPGAGDGHGRFHSDEKSEKLQIKEESVWT